MTRCEHDFARLAVDDIVGRLLSPPIFRDIRNLPATGPADPRDGVIEFAEDFLGREAKREEQCRDGKLALAVDADIDDIFGVEFEIEP